MKLFVQIPCLNEEKTLPLVLANIPDSIPGIEQIEILVIDDGSTDRTVEVARRMALPSCGGGHRLSPPPMRSMRSL